MLSSLLTLSTYTSLHPLPGSSEVILGNLQQELKYKLDEAGRAEEFIYFKEEICVTSSQYNCWNVTNITGRLISNTARGITGGGGFFAGRNH